MMNRANPERPCASSVVRALCKLALLNEISASMPFMQRLPPQEHLGFAPRARIPGE